MLARDDLYFHRKTSRLCYTWTIRYVFSTWLALIVMTTIAYTQDQKKIFVIDMRTAPWYPFSELAEKWLAKYVKQGKKIAILVNKKGYATGTVCQECGHIPRCEQCDVAIAVHQNKQKDYFGICHICKTQYSVDAHCPQCQWVDTRTYGVWAQQIKARIEQSYKTQNANQKPKIVVVESSKVNSPNKLKNITEELKTAQAVIGTSLLVQPVADVRFDLVIVVNADLWLNIPDMQANRNHFLFLYELFSKHEAPTFLIQTYNPEQHSLVHACNLDIEAMKKHELHYRKTHNYPPYTQMCVLLYKHEIEERLYTTTNKLYQELLFLKERYQIEDLEIYATPPLVYKTYGKYRYNIILKSSQLREFMDIAYSKLKIYTRGFKIDREPQHIL